MVSLILFLLLLSFTAACVLFWRGNFGIACMCLVLTQFLNLAAFTALHIY